jgi:AcrR family transcriptional regulator
MNIAPTKTPAAPTSEVKQRADARRNRKRVLDAARARFAEDGLDAQIDEIADAAGVGVGTVYRHFPTKEHLIEALVEARFERIRERGARALVEAENDPWEAFRSFMRFSVELQANDRALSQVMASHPETMRTHAEGSGVFELSGELLSLAQQSGDLREDAVVEDVPMIICGLGHVTQAARAGETAPGMSWERFLAIVLDGLRAPGSAPLPDRAATQR